MKRSLLIFGITGELGSRLAQLAVAAGHKVYGVSRGSHTLPGADLTGVEMLTGDKLDRDFLQNKCSKLPIDVIVDTKPVLESLQNYADFFPHVKNVFIVSSTGTFVPLQQLPADETHPWRVENHINFHAKISFDKLALKLYEEGKLPSKPDPAFYIEAAKRIGLTPEECIVVEDSRTGIQSAINAKAGKIVAIDRSTPKEWLESKPEIGAIIHDFTGFENWI
jgi:D-arabinose 1-dehydrogenase-like Zn-dependent alcohol dehydrogenase